MIFIETPTFTKLIVSLINDDDYKELQESLIANPKQGDIIKGSGGLRKMRWSIDKKGKSGGCRIIYYWVTENDQILMIFAYPKNKQDNLTKEQLKMLKNIVERWS